MAGDAHRERLGDRLARVGLRVRLAVAIGGISAIVADQARANAVQSAQALSLEVGAGRTSLPSGASIVQKDASDPIATLYDKFTALAAQHHSGSLVTSDHSRVIGSAPLRRGGQL